MDKRYIIKIMTMMECGLDGNFTLISTHLMPQMHLLIPMVMGTITGVKINGIPIQKTLLASPAKENYVQTTSLLTLRFHHIMLSPRFW